MEYQQGSNQPPSYLSHQSSARQSQRNLSSQTIFEGQQINILIEVDSIKSNQDIDLYNQCYQQIREVILKKIPRAIVQRRESEDPGSFEIKEPNQDNIIFSKLVFNQFPDPQKIVDRIICFYYDAYTSGDISEYISKIDLSSDKLGYKIVYLENGNVKVQKRMTSQHSQHMQPQQQNSQQSQPNFRIKKLSIQQGGRSGPNSQHGRNFSGMSSAISSGQLNDDLIGQYENYDCLNCQLASKLLRQSQQTLQQSEQLIQQQGDKIYKLEEKEVMNMGVDAGGENKMKQQILDMKNQHAKIEKWLQDELNQKNAQVLRLEEKLQQTEDELEDSKKQIIEIKKNINPDLEEEYNNLQQRLVDMKIMDESQGKQIEELQFLLNQIEVKNLEYEKSLRNKKRDLMISKSRIESLEKLIKIKTVESKEGSERLKIERKEKDNKIVQLEMENEDQQQKIDILQETMILKVSEKDTEIEEYKEMKYNFNNILSARTKEYEDKMKKLIKLHQQDKEKMSEYFYFYKKKHQTVFKPHDQITIGFIWNSQGEYESKASLINDIRMIHTSAGTKSKISENQEFMHSGVKARSIYDQEIFIDFSKIPMSCGVIALTVTSTTGINNLKKGLMHVSENGQICEQMVMKNIYGKVSCYLLAYFRRQEDGNWRILPANKSMEQMNESKLIMDNLNLSGYDFGPITESLNWNERSGKVFHISNNQIIAVPQKGYEEIKLGLGWDTPSDAETPLDLDGSIITFNKDGEMVDNINFQNLTSKDEAIIHQGDEQEGQGEGDDETIIIKLNKVDPKVDSMWVFISIYLQDKQFDDVDGAYGRFIIGDTEFCKYNMSHVKDPEANGCLMCNLFKVKKKWLIKGRGFFTKETYTSNDVIPIIGEIVDNNFDHVKIYTNEVNDEEQEEEQLEFNIENKNQAVTFDNHAQLKLLFKWNQNTKLSALNAHAVLLTEDGDKIESVNMRQQTTENNSLTHSGKIKDKEIDQEINVILSLIPEKAYTIAIMITGLRPINEMTRDAKLWVIYQDQIAHLQTFSTMATGKSYLAFFITRQAGNNFKLYPCQVPFEDSNIRKILKDSMHYAGKKAKVNMNALNWTVDCNKVYKLETDMLVPIPTSIQEDIIIGMGWDTPLDLDSSVIMLDSSGYIVDNIWWNNLETDGIYHQGDNRTGDSEGDDETIKINLKKLKSNVKQLWVYICLFEKENKFIEVNGEYFRIVVHGKEFARMDLGEIEDEVVNGCILCNFFLDEKGQWFLKGRGYYTQGAFTSQEAEPIIKSVYGDDMSQVKVFNNSINEDGTMHKKQLKYNNQEKILIKFQFQIDKEKQQQENFPLLQFIVSYTDCYGKVFATDYLLDYKKINYPMFLQQNQEEPELKNNIETQKYQLTLDFSKIPKETHTISFMLNCSKLYWINTHLDYSIHIGQNEVFSQAIHMPVDKSEYQNILLFFMHLDIQQFWQLQRICSTDYADIGKQEKLLDKFIEKAGLDPKFAQQANQWSPSQNLQFNMRQGDHLVIPSLGYGGMQLGLGWVTDLDIDCCIIMLDDKYNCKDYIYYDNLKSKDNSILHLGESNIGEDSDQEVLSLILKQVDKNISVIQVFIHIYVENKHLCDVKKSYCRLIIGGEEFCRYEVSQSSDGESDGCIMAEIYRINSQSWGIRAMGLYTRQMHVEKDLVNLYQDLQQYDYSKTRYFSNRHEHMLPRVQEASQNKKKTSQIITKFSDKDKLQLGFVWSLFLKITLETTAYILDIEGNIITTIEGKNNKQQNGLTHSGHLKTGEFKQVIDIDFAELPENAHILAFLVTSPQILNDYFRNGSIHFQFKGKKCYAVEMTNSTHKGMVLQYMVKDIHNPGYWTIGGSVKGVEEDFTNPEFLKNYLHLTKFERLQNIQRKFSPQSTILLGLQWNYAENIGLESNCFIVNDCGIIEGTVDQNQLLQSQNSFHNADVDEKDDYDQVFNINFNKIQEHLQLVALVVVSDKPVRGNLQSGSVQVKYEGKVVHSISFGGIQGNGIMIMFLKKTIGGQWELTQYARDFEKLSNQALISQYFHMTGMKGVVASEIQKAINWSIQNPLKLQISNEQVLPLPQNSVESGLTIGLGWDSKVDIDSALLMLDSVGNIYDNVQVQNLKSRDHSVIHKGDNRDGKGINDGDDEQIDVFFNKMDESVVSLWIFISIYTENKTFDQVKGAYVRLIIGNQEFCRFKVTAANDGESNGCLVCELSRKSGFWTIRGKGYYTQNTPNAESIVPIMGKVFKGDNSLVKIYAQQDKNLREEKVNTQQSLYNKPLLIGYQIQGQEQANGSVYIIDEMGQVIDYVELYRKVSKCKSIKHNGLQQEQQQQQQNQYGQEENILQDYSQIVNIDLTKINPEAKVLGIVVDCKTSNLNKILDSGAKVDLIYDNQIYKSYKIKEDKDKAIHIVYLKKSLKDKSWKIVTFNRKFFTGNTAKKAIQESLVVSGINIQAIEQAYDWQLGQGIRSISMKNDQILPLPQAALQNFVIGVGWDTNIDIDSSILLIDKNGNLVDKVYYNNLKSKDWAVIHKGDNVHNDPKNKEQQDKEEIEVKLEKLNSNIKSIWVFTNVYDSKKTFDEAKTLYVRLKIQNEQFCKYEVTSIRDGQSSGLLICSIQNYNDSEWVIKSRGYFTKNTYSSLEAVPIIKSVIQGNLSDISLPIDDY